MGIIGRVTIPKFRTQLVQKLEEEEGDEEMKQMQLQSVIWFTPTHYQF